MQPTGLMLDDLPHIHFDIQADFIVFKPMVGCTLKAVANKLGRDHIGCLVHGRFNASIPRPPNANGWAGARLRVGQEFMFEVVHIYCNNNFLSMKGALLPGSVISKAPTRRRFSDATSADLVATVDTTKDFPSATTPKKRKKHSKVKTSDSNDASLPETIASGKKKKHSRKDTLDESGISKRISQIPANDVSSRFIGSDSAFISDTSTVNESTLSLYTNKVKKKKHKYKDESSSLNDLPLLVHKSRSNKKKHKNKDGSSHVTDTEGSHVTDTDTSFMIGTSLLSESSQVSDTNKSKKKKHTHKHKIESSSDGKADHGYQPLPSTSYAGKIVPSPVKKAKHKHNMESGVSVESQSAYSAVASNNIELSQSVKKVKHKKIKLENT